MAFGQPSGPPATARQLRDLTALVEAAGHTDFRDARGPLGLTQRQAGGKFTQDEADGLIARLEAEAEAAGGDGPAHDEPARAAPVAPRRAAPRVPATRPAADPAAKPTTLAEQLERVPERLLVAELRRRGWRLVPPSPDG
jgi:hypothetical protein